jgi:hypothetical protein
MTDGDAFPRSGLRLRPAVVTNRSLAVSGPCFAALQAAGIGADALIAVNGLAHANAARRADEIRSIVPECTILTVRQAGANHARAALLAHADDDDILAFVDDDATIGPHWTEAMRRTWAAAGSDVGAVGGPIRAHFLAPRPSWLSDYLVGGLSIIDYGSELQQLTPDSGFLYLANLSLHAASTRRVGGFDDTLGPIAGTAGFGDDIELQRLMFRAGLKVLYVPDAWVYHRIPPERLKRRAMLDRRYRNGLDYARTRSGGMREALTMVSCIVRGAVATAKGNEADGMDKLAYAAQCAGELHGRLRVLKRRDRELRARR